MPRRIRRGLRAWCDPGDTSPRNIGSRLYLADNWGGVSRQTSRTAAPREQATANDPPCVPEKDTGCVAWGGAQEVLSHEAQLSFSARQPVRGGRRVSDRRVDGMGGRHSRLDRLWRVGWHYGARGDKRRPG